MSEGNHVKEEEDGDLRVTNGQLEFFFFVWDSGRSGICATKGKRLGSYEGGC